MRDVVEESEKHERKERGKGITLRSYAIHAGSELVLERLWFVERNLPSVAVKFAELFRLRVFSRSETGKLYWSAMSVQAGKRSVQAAGKRKSDSKRPGEDKEEARTD
jgi:hypothetical protein